MNQRMFNNPSSSTMNNGFEPLIPVSDDRDQYIEVEPSKIHDKNYDGNQSKSPGPNPYTTLSDIVNSQQAYDPVGDALALFQSGNGKQQKVSDVLSNLVRENEDPDEPLSAEQGMQPLWQARPVKLGTLQGVYLPTIQNIFGVILYLRFAWIVGNAGVGESLLIVGICCTTTLLTAFSMSAIATNGVVPGGGAYFMISRALGPEFGGAVGILFYLGTSTAGAMYILGAVELLLTYTESTGGDNLDKMRAFGTCLLLGMAFLVFIGVKYVNRFASLCLVAVLLSIVCMFLGFFSSPYSGQSSVCLFNGTVLRSFNQTASCESDAFPGLHSSMLKENFGSHYLQKGESKLGVQGSGEEVVSQDDTSFTMLLAIFFPSCTGIMAGSNRSGDLKDASASIPRGTIMAILTTSSVYLLCVIFIGGITEGAVLRDKLGESIGGRLVMAEASWPSQWIVFVGALLSCIGAGLQSLTGAPRLLRAIAQDDLLPILRVFGKSSASGEPVRALILTVLIAEGAVLIASLDLVAPIITMFFLMCYAFVNLACALQSLLKSPSWRPTYQFYHWTLSALGMVLCALLMLISSWIYAVVAFFLAALLYYLIQYNGAVKEWGDGLRGLSLQAAKFSLLRLEDNTNSTHTKNWRPQLLVLTSLNRDWDPKDKELLDFSGQLKGGKGFTMVASVLVGKYQNQARDVKVAKLALKRYMLKSELEGFADTIMCPCVEDGFDYLIQSSGLGVLKHNTVVIGWPDSWQEKNTASIFLKAIRVTTAAELAIVVPKNIRAFPAGSDPMSGTVDVWWIVHDGGMLLLVAFLLKKHKIWAKCRLRVFCIAEGDDNSIQMERDLVLFLKLLRIRADVKIVELECTISDRTNHVRLMQTATKMNSVLREHSMEASLVMLSLPEVPSPEPGQDEAKTNVKYLELLEELIAGLNRVIMIRGGGSEVITIFN
eukprot:m.88294 g.88294  ORF g.88294 m.88294 type:complete len:942 (+) comp13158_c0_seq1:178-3003(+)